MFEIVTLKEVSTILESFAGARSELCLETPKAEPTMPPPRPTANNPANLGAVTATAS